MEPSREERVLQRLRGASRRQIKDVDFGLAIPAAVAPLQSSPPASAAPQVELSPHPPNEQNPALPPPPSTATPDSIRPALSHSVNDANTSAKRRKLDSELPPVSSGRSTRSSRTPRADIYELVDDDPPPEQPALERDGPLPGQVVDALVAQPPIVEQDTIIEDVVPEPIATPSVHFAEETTILFAGVPVEDELAQMVTAESTVLSVREFGDEILAPSSDIETPVPARKRKRGILKGTPKQSTPLAENDIDELSPEQPIRRVTAAKATIQAQGGDGVRDPLSDPAEAEEAEGIDDHEAAIILTRTRGRKKSIDPPTISREDDADVLELPKSKRQRKQERQESNRAEQRQPKQTNSKNTKVTRKPSGKAKIRAGSPIPVTIHRLSRQLVYDDEEADADILNAKISHSRRGGVNPIDVLREVCQEIVGSAIETLSEGRSNSEDPALKREYMTKERAVEAFGHEVDARLIEHSVNLDNAYSLERRVKDENRKKLVLRQDILRVRAEREKVALRMDEIRIRHEKEAASFRELNALNTAVHDIELAVERGQTSEPNEDSIVQTPDISSIEILLKRIAGDVSNKGDEGGLLKQIRDFNGFLERAAFALETRKA